MEFRRTQCGAKDSKPDLNSCTDIMVKDEGQDFYQVVKQFKKKKKMLRIPQLISNFDFEYDYQERDYSGDNYLSQKICFFPENSMGLPSNTK